MAVLAMSKSILIVETRGHCRRLGNELADYQAKPGATETQPDNTLDAATRKALIRRSHPALATEGVYP